MRRGSRGMAGLGALIMLVAILLAVSITAMVLMSSSTTLMTHEQQLQKEKTKGIQQPIIVDIIRGKDTSGNKRLDELEIGRAHV